MIAELVVQGGAVVTEDGVGAADVVVTAGRIAAIVGAGTGRAAEVVAARGLAVLPGAVDAHVHLNEPGRAHWEGWLAGTRGAAAGGTTTVLDMPLNSLPPTVDLAAFDAKRAAAEALSLVDFGLWGGIVGDDPDALRALHERGAVGFKAFLCPSGVDEFPPLDDATLRSALENAARLGCVVGVHAEDAALLDAATERLRVAGRRDPRAWAESRPVASEVASIERVASLARETRARVHVVHASSAAAVAAVRRARDAGAGITVETCPHYLLLTEDDLEAAGPLLKCAPPLRKAAEREALWRAVLDGDIDLVASDHSPSAAEEKLRGERDIWAAWGGIAGIQVLLPALLSEGVHRRGPALERVAQLVATAPARRFGLYPR